MKFDKHDNPTVRATGVDVGPASMMPTHYNDGTDAIVQGTRDVASAAKVFKEEREKAGLFRSRKQELQFAEEAGKLENEFRARRDESALDTADVLDKIDALREQYAGDLDGDALEDYKLRTGLRKLSMVDGLEKHAADQRVKIYGAVSDKAFEEMKDRAVKDYNNPAKIEQALSLGLSTMMDYLGRHLKLDDATVEKTLDEAQAQVYGVVLEQYKTNRQFTSGREYLDKIRGNVGEETAAKWDAAFRKLTDDAEVEALATSAWANIEDQATDPVNKRFNPVLARAALKELYSTQDIVRIESKINAEIVTAVAAQDEEDKQKKARLLMGHREVGRLDKTGDDFTGLDDQGQNEVEAAVAVADRIKANDTKERLLQSAINRMGLHAWQALASPELRANIEDEDIWLLVPGIDKDGVLAIQAARQKEKEAIAKTSVSTRELVDARVNKVYPILKAKYKENTANAVRDAISSWWAHEAADGKPPSITEVEKRLGEEVLLLQTGSFPFKSYRPAGSISPLERGSYPVAPLDDQIFEEAKRLIRGEFDAKKDGEKAKPAKVIYRNNKTGELRRNPPGMKHPDWTEVSK